METDCNLIIKNFRIRDLLRQGILKYCNKKTGFDIWNLKTKMVPTKVLQQYLKEEKKSTFEPLKIP